MPELYYDVTASKNWVLGVTKGTLDEGGPPDRINVLEEKPLGSWLVPFHYGGYNETVSIFSTKQTNKQTTKIPIPRNWIMLASLDFQTSEL